MDLKLSSVELYAVKQLIKAHEARARLLAQVKLKMRLSEPVSKTGSDSVVSQTEIKARNSHIV